MVIKLDFNMSAWVKELKIEADSELEALKQVQSMTVAELIEAGAIIDSEWDISDARTEVAERDLVVKATNIEYDFHADELDLAIVDYLKVRLPKELTVKLSSVEDLNNIEEQVKDEILVATGYDVESCDFEIIETK